MAYDQTTRSTKMVEPLPAHHEYVQTESVYTPEPRGFSGMAVAALVIGAVALVTVIFLTLNNKQSLDNQNAQQAARDNQQQQQPIVIQQPAAQPQTPVVIQQPASVPAPVVVQQPASGALGTAELDMQIQSDFDQKLKADRSLADLNVTATSIAGKISLAGAVATQKQKDDIEKMTRTISGVKDVDNQLMIMPAS